MGIFDLSPLQGTYAPGQDVSFQLELAEDTDLVFPLEIKLSIWHLFTPVAEIKEKISSTAQTAEEFIIWSPPPGVRGGFGVLGELFDSSGAILGSTLTAFDILRDWIEFPRYGFLTDFFPDRSDCETTLKTLVRYHINGLQYYDWQYRHDKLIPPEKKYTDPLGRVLSLETIQKFINLSQKFGIKSMPYMAVYAASLDFWKRNPDWALYDSEGQPLYFEDFLGIMDPSQGSPWIEYIKGECDKVLRELSFDGIHIDQYGDPKEGTTSAGDPVDIPAAFTDFVNDLKAAHPQKTILFNAVGNWPIEALAESRQDFLYIEVWPPSTRYQDLSEIITNARKLSGEKPVVIAVYISSTLEANVRLADAFIIASGGTRIELGEGGQLLADPYFPKHEPVSPELSSTLIRYYDFLVCYGDLIGPSVKRRNDFPLDTPSGIFSSVCAGEDLFTICLVNQTGNSELHWNQPHPPPTVLTDLEIKLKFPEKIKGVWWGSPDQIDWQLKPVEWSQDGELCQLHVSQLEYWGIFVISFEEKD